MNDWNKLPVNLIELTDTDSFKNELESLLYVYVCNLNTPAGLTA